MSQPVLSKADARDVLEFDAVLDLVAQYARTSLGKRYARKVSPAKRIDLAREWLESVAELDRWLSKGGPFPISGAHDVTQLVRDARHRGSPLEPGEIREVGETLRAAIEIRQTFEPESETMKCFWRVARKLPSMDALVSRIINTIDSRGQLIAPPGSPLNNIRVRLEKLQDQAYQRVLGIMRQGAWRKFLRDGGPILRNGRYVLAIRHECRNEVRGIYHDRSGSGSTAYVEPEAMVDIQSDIQDLVDAEQKEVRGILVAFTRELLQSRSEIEQAVRILGVCDFTYARAVFCQELGGSYPTLVEKGPMRWRDLRHPLLLDMAKRGSDEKDPKARLESAKKNVIPLELSLGDLFDVLVITGPNTGGKTVLLKTAGLAVMMALSGIPVSCAEGSQVPFCRSVLADIGDEQDIQQSLSTFSSHMKRIAEILEHAGPDVLVLLDELGSGTDPAEGEAIGYAILNHLVARNVPTLVSTHLGRLKEFATLVARAENGSMEFDTESLRPTYKLTIGIPGESNALRVARSLGLPDDVLDEAEKRSLESRGDAAGLLENVQRIRHHVQENLESTERDRLLAERIREDLEKRLVEAEGRARIATMDADRAIEDAMKKARRTLEDALRPLRNAPAHIVPKIDHLRKALEGCFKLSPLAERRRRYLRSLKRDDKVRLPRYRETCRLKRIDFEAQTLEVTYGNISLNVPFDEVSCPEEFDPEAIKG